MNQNQPRQETTGQTKTSEKIKRDMDYQLLMDTAVLAGEIMLVAGAETYRVEDTIRRMLQTSGFERCDVFVVATGIMATLADWRVDTLSITRRVGEKNTNLGNISDANDISRKYCSGEMTLKQAFHDLKRIRSQRYPVWLNYICMVLTAAFFTILLGGGWAESCFAAMNGLIIVLGQVINRRFQVNGFVLNMAMSFLMSFTCQGFARLPGLALEMEPLIAGSIMALLPGVAITNAIRDTLQGDYMSGAARVIEAFVIAASLGVGVGAGLAFGGTVFGGGV